jgi:hypothetical protein
MQDRAIKQNDTIQFFRVGSYLTADNRHSQPIASFYTLPGRLFAVEWVCRNSIDDRQGPQTSSSQSIQTGFPILASPGSATHTSILANWIHSCNQSHTCYPRDLNFVPTRLLDVGNDDGLIRLSHEAYSHRSPVLYAALSHQWGSIGQHRNFCTYTTNFEELKQNIDIKNLPKTYQDAIRITRSLGVQYLWIDSLCIIQDDPDDWEQESKLMEQVFSSAYCTLAASCARGANDSFLKPRPERHGLTLRNPHNFSLYYLYESIDDFHRHVDQSDLNMRGWVLQERALSRRTIYFTEMQSYWECGRGVRCETLTKSKKSDLHSSRPWCNCADLNFYSRKASFLGDSNFPHSVESYVKGMKIELYQDLYTRYSKLALSFSADRPIAIKGLEARLIQTFGTTGGYGVFELYLHRCLLWKREGEVLNRIGLSYGKQIPSWSWMAYEGGIRYMDVPYGRVSWREDIISPFAKVDELDETNDIATERSKGEMRLEIKAPVWDLLGSQSETIILDEPDRKLSQTPKCVIIGESKTATHEDARVCYVLIVVPIATVNGIEVCERIGVGSLERRHIRLDGQETMVRIQ